MSLESFQKTTDKEKKKIQQEDEHISDVINGEAVTLTSVVYENAINVPDPINNASKDYQNAVIRRFH